MVRFNDVGSTSGAQAGGAPEGEPVKPSPREARRRGADAGEGPLRSRPASSRTAGSGDLQNRRRSEAPRQRDDQPAVPQGTSWAGTLWKAYVGVLAAGAGYGALRSSGLLSGGAPAPGGNAPGTLPAELGFAQPGEPRVSMPIVEQSRADVLGRYGSYIAPGNPCHDVVPALQPDLGEVRDGSSAGIYRGKTERVPSGPDRGKPTAVSIHAGLRPDVGAHTARHEFLHCYSHPAFLQMAMFSGQSRHLEEAFTEHFADQFPDHPRTSTFADLPMANGKTGVAAAKELERAVGKATLRRAFFRGDADAVRRVADALVDAFPKVPTALGWVGVARFNGKPGHQRALAECFVGMSLLHAGRLPAEMPGVNARQFLPLRDFAEVTPAQAQSLRRQAEALREKLGSAFDRAFCAADPALQRQAMDKIADELQRNWRPVLS